MKKNEEVKKGSEEKPNPNPNPNPNDVKKPPPPPPPTKIGEDKRLSDSNKGNKLNYGDKILGTANFNDLEFGVPKYYKEHQNSITSADPLLKVEEDAAKGRKSILHPTKVAPATHPGILKASGRKSIGVTVAHKGGENVAPGRKSVIADGTAAGHRRPSHVRLDITVDNDSEVFVPEELDINFHEKEVNESLQILLKKSRIFIRRHPLNHKRFDVVDEEGTKIFQLNDFTTGDEGTSLNYCLYAADGKTQLLILQGNPGFLGRNGELVARYPGSQPKHKELIFGKVEQETLCCSCQPQYRVKNGEGQLLYDIIDKNPYCILNPCRHCTHSEFEMRKGKAFPTVFGKIEERQLIHPNRKIMKPGGANYTTRNSTTSGHSNEVKKNSNHNSNRKSLVVAGGGSTRMSADFNKHAFGSTNIGIQGAPLLGQGQGQHPPDRRRESITTHSEKATHEYFCIGFKDTINFKDRVLFLVSHLLVNDEYFGNTTCTRQVFIIYVVVIILVAIAVGSTVGVFLLRK